MANYYIIYHITIKISGKEEIVNKLCTDLELNGVGESWDYSKQTDEKYGDIFVVKGEGYETGKYYPGKCWGPPEDCYPDDFDFEDGNFYEGDLDEHIVKFETDYSREDFNVIHIKVDEDWQ